MNEVKKNLTEEEKIVADQVADEILVVREDSEDRKYFALLLIFLICLIFLISSLSFAIFENYYNGGNANVIDVGIDVVVGDKDGHGKPSSVLFSFNEGSNYIDMKDVFPTYDNVGKKLNGNKQFFDFNVSAKFGNKSKGTLIYEIALVPMNGNTVDENDVRVYLTEDGKDVSINNNMINNFGDLPGSSFHEKGKVIYRKVVKNNNYVGKYVFRMWISSDADVADVSEKFACKVIVNAYYK